MRILPTKRLKNLNLVATISLKTHIFNDDLCVLGLFLFKVRDDCLPTHVQEDLHSTERRRYGCLLVDFLFSDVDAHLDQSMGYVDVIY